MKTLIAILLALILLYGAFHLAVNGWHYQTSQGDHTGYITAVETNGVFFKTHTAYLKTNTTSTQEDAYCVVDSAVFDQLQQASVATSHVNVHFIDWILAGWANCGGGSTGVITSMTVLPN